MKTIFRYKSWVLLIAMSLASHSMWAENLDWVNVLGAGATNIKIKPLPSGNFIVAFTLIDTIDTDPGPGTQYAAPVGINDVFVAKYNADGQMAWHFQIGTANSYADLQDFAVSNTGEIYLAGTVSKVTDFDPSANNAILTPSGTYSPFVAHYDSSGNYSKAVLFSIAANSYINAIGVNNLGDVYIGGGFTNQIDMDPSAGVANLTTVNPNITAGFVGHYGADLTYISAYAVASGGNSDEIVNALSIDYNNNVYFTGHMTASVDFDFGAGTAVVNTTDQDIFIAQYDNQLNYLSAGKISSPQADYPGGITVFGGNVYVWGNSTGAGLDCDPGVGTFLLNDPGLSTYGYYFVGSYSTTGLTFNWAKQFASVSLSINSVKPTLNGIAVALNFKGTIDIDPGPNVLTLTDSSFTGVLLLLSTNADYQGNVHYDNLAGNNKIIFNDILERNNLYYVSGYFTGNIDFDFNAGTHLESCPAGSSGYGFLMAIDELAVEPTTNSTAVTFTNPSDSSVTVNFPGGDGQKRLVLVKVDSIENLNPSDAVFYANDTVFGTNDAGNQNFALYADTGHLVNVTGLDAAHHTYYFAVFQFNGLSVSINYLSTSAARGSYTTAHVGINATNAVNNEWKVYPNPASNYLYLDLSNLSEQANVKLFDLTGKVIKESWETSSTTMNITGLAAGVYYLQVTTGTKTMTSKVIKTN